MEKYLIHACLIFQVFPRSFFFFVFSGTKQKVKRNEQFRQENIKKVKRKLNYNQALNRLKSERERERESAQFTGRSVVVCGLNCYCVAVGIRRWLMLLRHLSLSLFFFSFLVRETIRKQVVRMNERKSSLFFFGFK